ncbi:phage portal protein [Schinkia azotoformans]|uniref:phage portal protein n=1 Tax=Schinkia azotoformans TaxID=1454 RepID=UPI002DC04CB8|nr:phage portal protein [Schinkia azotoformans]MEC1772827.1 phage portal protein [Schinkia azotoformans]MED4367454.1 phage portal protein [Schinkia azotoformans]
MVTSNQIRDAIKKHKLELPRYQKLYNYYIGKNSILNRILPDPEKPNNKIATSYPSTIIDTVVGYFAARPISYISKSGNEQFLNDLQDVLFLNDSEDTDAEIVKDFSIFGKSYEYMWVDQAGQIRFAEYSPLEMAVVKDRKDNIQFAFRYWTEKVDNKSITKVELYNDVGIYYLISDDGENFVTDPNEESKPHFFGEVPVSIYKNNDEEIGDFEKQIPMIDQLDKLLSDSSNELESWVNAYLVLAGYKGTQSEDIHKMKQDGVLLLDDVGQAKFLTKDINVNFQQNFFDTVDNLIHQQTATPKLTSEEFSSNLSGIAIGFKLFGLESKSMIKERKMEKALRKRIRLITTILNLKKNSSYSFADIRFNFVRNLPQNEAEIADQMTKLINIVDHETLLSWHPRIQEPSQVIKKLKEEDDSVNLDDIGDDNE